MTIFEQQLRRMKQDKGFIAALDQSGGSTPKALTGYGIQENAYKNEDEMYGLIHAMRSRVLTDKSFTGDKILGVILFEKTLNAKVEGMPTTEYLWKKHIVPFLKIDKGLEEKKNDVQLMKPIPNLAGIIQDAKSKGVFGTKMRSVIFANNQAGIAAVVQQQFEFARIIIENGLVPIIEPEVDIHAADKKEIEATLKAALLEQLNKLTANQNVMLKLTLPAENNFYSDLTTHPQVVRVVALSGGYDFEKATNLLANNKNVIASFSRALLDDLRVDQTTEQFSTVLSKAIDGIYNASIT
ncbi:fructose bisphosphate aldolase [Cytophaga hutchinsonii]|uniref:Fructose-bisphosphate aldolase class 1 n=1 Tax=Cytophaga hutchinsonii (strain ATCC 33406 / DSM 1761 / CIP 103989 / NBRC 15051 / NCIMB 9469 / D465) TaxID=269798 RepID=A0A6N4SQR2_CYTH3|nr:fructose bisphosphate aldolase [Cytophaga hutchinsonii]ABG58613.1 fructose-bisphosphate aldolase [Cytophaga hutchinsonii ATCC 33406]SFX58032.1 fructose-bisphosphate aldolase, class I [Cytophaga hutchinsonii ATCC 33406]